MAGNTTTPSPLGPSRSASNRSRPHNDAARQVHGAKDDQDDQDLVAIPPENHLTYYTYEIDESVDGDEVVRPPPRTGAQHLASGSYALKGLIKANTEVHGHETTQSFIDPIGSYIELVTDPKSTNLEVVEKVRRPSDLKKLKDPVVKMKDCPYPCNYGKFMEAGEQRDVGSTVPDGTEGFYIVMAENGEERNKGHDIDAKRAPSRLIYAMQAVADLIESIIIVMIEDVDAFKRHLIRLYGADHPLASLCARDLVQSFLSTTEAVLIIIFRSSRASLRSERAITNSTNGDSRCMTSAAGREKGKTTKVGGSHRRREAQAA